MGYLTDYKLDYDTEDMDRLLELEIFTYINNEPSAVSYGDPIAMCLEECCKWYDSDKDMLVLSNKFPTVLFTLSGEGEESGDIWRWYYLGGKSQRCSAKITFDDFDPEKLK